MEDLTKIISMSKIDTKNRYRMERRERLNNCFDKLSDIEGHFMSDRSAQFLSSEILQLKQVVLDLVCEWKEQNGN